MDKHFGMSQNHATRARMFIPAPQSSHMCWPMTLLLIQKSLMTLVIGEFPQPPNIDGKVVNLEVLLRPLTEIGDELGSWNNRGKDHPNISKPAWNSLSFLGPQEIPSLDPAVSRLPEFTEATGKSRNAPDFDSQSQFIPVCRPANRKQKGNYVTMSKLSIIQVFNSRV